MFKKSLFLGISSGILSGVAGIILEKVYATAFYTDFSTTTATFGGSLAITTSPTTLLLISVFTGVLAGVVHALLTRWSVKWGDVIFGFLFTLISFASILLPISATLPLDLDEYTTLLFPSFLITLNFFPALVWFTLKPLFFRAR